MIFAKSMTPPSTTKSKTSLLLIPGYGCIARVAISHSTIPNDLQGSSYQYLQVYGINRL